MNAEQICARVEEGTQIRQVNDDQCFFIWTASKDGPYQKRKDGSYFYPCLSRCLLNNWEVAPSDNAAESRLIADIEAENIEYDKDVMPSFETLERVWKIVTRYLDDH